MVHEKVSSTKEDQLSDIWESWNHFDEEYRFKWVKSLPERIKVALKTGKETIKYQF